MYTSLKNTKAEEISVSGETRLPQLGDRGNRAMVFLVISGAVAKGGWSSTGIRRIIKEGLSIARCELGEANKNHTDGQEPISEIPWLIPITNAY